MPILVDNSIVSSRTVTSIPGYMVGFTELRTQYTERDNRVVRSCVFTTTTSPKQWHGLNSLARSKHFRKHWRFDGRSITMDPRIPEIFIYFEPSLDHKVVRLYNPHWKITMVFKLHFCLLPHFYSLYRSLNFSTNLFEVLNLTSVNFYVWFME